MNSHFPRRADRNALPPHNPLSRSEMPLHDPSKLTRQTSGRFIRRESSSQTPVPSRHILQKPFDRGGNLNGSSALNRTTSFRTPTTQDISRYHDSSLRDTAALNRTTSFRTPPSQGSSKLSRKESHYRESSLSKSGQSDADQSRLSRQTSHKVEPQPELDKEDRRRRRNRESARRARERERSERELREKAYDANEIRIKHLEKIVDELSSELRRHNTISGVQAPSGRSSSRRQESDSKASGPSDRPSWFGAPF